MREPLLHFFVAGALLFVLYAALNRDAMQSPDEIVVDQARVDSLETQFERVWRRPPTDEELSGLVNNWIEEEVLYREGVALGLDQDDPVIRRRVAQKIEFMADAVIESEPDQQALEAWLEAHADRYSLDPVVSFRQVFFDPRKHGPDLESVVAAARAALVDGDDEVGDATLLPQALDGVARPEVTRTFGTEFAVSILDLPEGQWSGPVRSGYGMHLVYVEKLVPGRPAALEEVRDQVVRDLLVSRKEEARKALYESLKAQYEILLPDGGLAVADSR